MKVKIILVSGYSFECRPPFGSLSAIVEAMDHASWNLIDDKRIVKSSTVAAIEVIEE